MSNSTWQPLFQATDEDVSVYVSDDDLPYPVTISFGMGANVTLTGPAVAKLQRLLDDVALCAWCEFGVGLFEVEGQRLCAACNPAGDPSDEPDGFPF